MWAAEAERRYLLAQALPNVSADQLEDMPASELDAVLMVADLYRADMHRRMAQQ